MNFEILLLNSLSNRYIVLDKQSKYKNSHLSSENIMANVKDVIKIGQFLNSSHRIDNYVSILNSVKCENEAQVDYDAEKGYPIH